MNIKDIFADDDISKRISALKKRSTDAPLTDLNTKHLDPTLHDIMDPAIRPNKLVQYQEATIVNGQEETRYGTRWEPVARVALAMQRLIVNRAVAFLFGNPVRYNCQTSTPDQEKARDLFLTALREAKIDTINRRAARAVMSHNEAAEHWFTVDKDKGYLPDSKSKKKLRCALYSPENGDSLYPLFDEYGDLIAFSREYIVKDGDASTLYFETYTAENTYRWQQSSTTGNQWADVEGYPKQNIVGKIPIIYAYQEDTEWSLVQNLIDRLEKVLSNFADTNDYHASPTIVSEGEVEGFASKGEQGKIIQTTVGSKVYYLSWDKAPESVKLEVETLLNLIYTQTQTPDISFQGLQDNDAISGKAIRLMFMDAHLKAMDKMEIFGDYLTRRTNLIKAFLGKIETGSPVGAAIADMDIDYTVTPYMLDDDAERVKMLVEAAGGKPVLSQRQAVELAAFTQNADKEWEQLQSEQNALENFENANPTI